MYLFGLHHSLLLQNTHVSYRKTMPANNTMFTDFKELVGPTVYYTVEPGYRGHPWAKNIWPY